MLPITPEGVEARRLLREEMEGQEALRRAVDPIDAPKNTERAKKLAMRYGRACISSGISRCNTLR